MPGALKKQSKYGGVVRNSTPRSGGSRGSSRSSGKGKGRGRNPMSAAAIKQALLKSADQKVKVMRGGLVSPTHNKEYPIFKNLYSSIIAGTSSQSRLGDDVYISRIRMKVITTDDNWTNMAVARGPTKLRFVTFSCNKVFDAKVPLLAATNTLPNSCLSDQTGECFNHFLGSIDQDMVKVLDDSVIAVDMNSGFTKQFEINIPVNKKITYSTADEIFGQNNVCCYMTPYLDVGDWSNVLSSDVTLANMEVELTIFFKDAD